MFSFDFRTRGGAEPQGRPRVFFTCHPDDFDRSFEKICADLLKSQDCAIYYTADMSGSIADDDRETELEQMNLFVIPVSFRLLTSPSRAMDRDLPFAREKHIPVLPVMLEPGLETVYSRPDRFGTLQFIDPFNADPTAIPYEEKLRRFLAGVLFDSATAERVRGAFDAYIFLSYRKKDRRFANELMRLIHSNPVCRDIAIWYDEFLIPGESFDRAIGEMLDKCDLFALLVTPNLVNEENYVQTTEYPAAHSAGKTVLPAEMAPTDYAELKRLYDGIPECVDARDDGALRDSLAQAFREYALRENDSDPAHNFLIGLAYLDGIDVEVDRARALELITGAAEAGLPEAMEKLCGMYYNGDCVPLDWREENKWRERLAEHYEKTLGAGDEKTLGALNSLALSLDRLGEYEKALRILDKVRTFPDEGSLDMAAADFSAAQALYHLGEYEQALNISSGAFKAFSAAGYELLTINAAELYAMCCRRTGNAEKGLALSERAYQLCVQLLGEDDPRALTALNNLSQAYFSAGNYAKAAELQESAYELFSRVLGEDHPETIVVLHNLAGKHAAMRRHRQALECQEKAYRLSCETLGSEHPNTVLSLIQLAQFCGEAGYSKRALELGEKAYQLSCAVFGEEHQHTLAALCILASAYSDCGSREKALSMNEKAYEVSLHRYGGEDRGTVRALVNLVSLHIERGELNSALELGEKAYELSCRVFGKKHPDAMNAAKYLINAYLDGRDFRNAAGLLEKTYRISGEIFGSSDAETLQLMYLLADCRLNMGDRKAAVDLYEQIFSLCRSVSGKLPKLAVESKLSAALLYDKAGNNKKALEACGAIEHADMDKKTAAILAGLYSRCGRPDKASALLRKRKG